MNVILELLLKFILLGESAMIIGIIHEVFHVLMLKKYGYDGEIRFLSRTKEYPYKFYFFYTSTDKIKKNIVHAKEHISILLFPLIIGWLWFLPVYIAFDYDIIYSITYGLLLMVILSRYDIKTAYVLYDWWLKPNKQME